MADMHACGAVSEVTVNRLYSVFVDIDRDGTGALDLLEFNRYIGVEETEFTDRVFHLFGAPAVQGGPGAAPATPRPAPGPPQTQTATASSTSRSSWTPCGRTACWTPRPS